MIITPSVRLKISGSFYPNSHTNFDKNLQQSITLACSSNMIIGVLRKKKRNFGTIGPR
jgi:hypothetical protein